MCLCGASDCRWCGTMQGTREAEVEQDAAAVLSAMAAAHTFEPLFYDPETCHDCGQPRAQHGDATR